MNFPEIEMVRRITEMNAVYRMYDVTGRLWYVGVSANPFTRVTDGHEFKRWFPVISQITLQWFPNREEAEEAEIAAIRNERPYLNIAGVIREQELPAITQDEARDLDPVTLREAVGLGIAKVNLIAARRRSTRDPNHPRPIGMKDKAALYDACDLAAYYARAAA